MKVSQPVRMEVARLHQLAQKSLVRELTVAELDELKGSMRAVAAAVIKDFDENYNLSNRDDWKPKLKENIRHWQWVIKTISVDTQVDETLVGLLKAILQKSMTLISEKAVIEPN